MKPMGRANYDRSVEILEDALRRSKLGNREKLAALWRLALWEQTTRAIMTMSGV